MVLELAVMFDGAWRRLLLGRGLQEKFVNRSHGQTLGQVIVRAVLVAAMITTTVGLAATAEAFDEGCPQEVGAKFELGKQQTSALAQSKRGFADSIVNLLHLYRQATAKAAKVNKKEHALRMRKCS